MNDALRTKAPSSQTLIQMAGMRPARVQAAIISPAVSQPRTSCSKGRSGTTGSRFSFA